MSNIIRYTFFVNRHAQPLVDPVTKRSLDVLTAQGLADSIAFGGVVKAREIATEFINTFANVVDNTPEGVERTNVLQEQGAALGKACAQGTQELPELHVRYSLMFRAVSTAGGLVTGIGRSPTSYDKDENIGLGVFKGKKLPTGIDYGPEFIQYVLENNPGIENNVAANFGQSFSQLAVGDKDRTILMISHGPLVEISIGKKVGYDNQAIPGLAMKALGGYYAQVERNVKSGSFSDVHLSIDKVLQTKVSPSVFFGGN